MNRTILTLGTQIQTASDWFRVNQFCNFELQVICLYTSQLWYLSQQTWSVGGIRRTSFRTRWKSILRFHRTVDSISQSHETGGTNDRRKPKLHRYLPEKLLNLPNCLTQAANNDRWNDSKYEDQFHLKSGSGSREEVKQSHAAQKEAR